MVMSDARDGGWRWYCWRQRRQYFAFSVGHVSFVLVYPACDGIFVLIFLACQPQQTRPASDHGSSRNSASAKPKAELRMLQNEMDTNAEQAKRAKCVRRNECERGR
jgi:hypothetical protein